MSLPSTPAFESRIVTAEDLAARLAHLPRRLILRNGCFDILHGCQVTVLPQAYALGASMAV